MSHRRLAEIEISRIRTNPYQPRKHFDLDQIRDLADSIAQVGLIQPITVRQSGEFFELVAGERRLRACQELELETITAVVVEVESSDQQLMALVENIHREGLSSVEEAIGLKDILENTGWGQSELARRLGRSQASVANKLRLLKLEEPVQKMIMEGLLGERAARALVGLPPALQIGAAKRILDQDLTAREAEALVSDLKEGKPLDPKPTVEVPPAEEEPAEREIDEPINQEAKKKKASGPSLSGPEGPTGDLLQLISSLVESQRKKGVPVIWKVKELAQSELVVEIVVNLKEKMIEAKEKMEGEDVE
ncbi:ParB/RepB/Spo0J family partition protein [Dethiosulfovibrio salsuginis]|uniref:Chromosome partitioning protein, ParB family n=1 Tax=Dethiosulfovibrio salsuginis TaxID=561720 RepID=A0A1X7J253_9BACT|nr:ParB/RepB/Spo0J family partition protein [Dethiosulfovibrio salsuginis]SMG21426.1 chromosome partitioning protein, ParB family [Dethiosulfovibrio salsuginis]